jgi:Flp pilus assembly protein TadG
MRKSFFPFRVLKDSSGVATIEFAFVSGVLLVALLNGLEFARWSFQKMETANAVHSATQAVWSACDTNHLPAKTNCTGLTTAITNGLKSTSLGTAVTLSATYPTEAYYCVNTSNALQQVAAYTAAKPANCTAAGDTTRVPGDYVTITATYTYTPLFGSPLTFGNLLPTTITSSGFIRLQ